MLGELNLTVPVALDLGECGNLGGLGYTCEYNPVGGLEYSWNLHQRPLWVLLDEEGRAMTSIREPWTITDLEALIRVLVD